MDWLEYVSRFMSLLIIPTIAILVLMEYRYRKKRDITGEKQYRETLAKDLQKDQDLKAEKLEDKTHSTTRQNREDLMEIIMKNTQDLTTFINHKLELVYKTFEIQNVVIAGVIRDAIKDGSTRDKAFGRLEQSQDILSQWYYGIKVKSDWPLLSDTSETKEHREEQHSLDPQESIFSPTKDERESGETTVKVEDEYFELNPDGTKGKKVEKKNGN
jgi:hypothetical protein